MKTGIPALLCAAAIVLGSVSASMAAPMALDVTDGGKKMMGDPTHGKEIFNRCMVCHTIQPGVNYIGPSLHGVVGRKAGSIPGFAYSNANKKSGIVWTEQKIYDYLKNPPGYGAWNKDDISRLAEPAGPRRRRVLSEAEFSLTNYKGLCLRAASRNAALQRPPPQIHQVSRKGEYKPECDPLPSPANQ